MDAIMNKLEQFLQLIQEVSFVAVTNQWRGIEIELAKLQSSDPEAFKILSEAWQDDGWLVAPPWAPTEPEG